MDTDSELTAGRIDGAIVLRVAGPLDLSNAPALCTAIDRLAGSGEPAPIVVDLREVESCDPRCIVALINAAREAEMRLGRRVALEPGEGRIAAQLARAGAGEFLTLGASAETGR